MTDIEHVKRASEIEADRIYIRFGEEVRKRLEALEKIAYHNADLDEDMEQRLKALNSDKPIDIVNAIATLAIVVRDMTEYAEKTGDTAAATALNRFIGSFTEHARDGKAVHATVTPKERGR